MRNRTVSQSLAAAIATLALAACGHDEPAAGAYVTAPGQASATASTPPPPATLPGPIAAPLAAPEPDPVPELEYADVTRVRTVQDSSPVYGTVVASDAVTQDVPAPQQVCRDVVVQETAPERDGLKGGTIAGAVIGGLVGNQVGSGEGKKAATVAGAIAGGYAGREIDRRHVGGNVVSHTEQQCETQNVPTAQVLGYDITYRDPDGATHHQRMDAAQAVGSRISLGSRSRVVGYDVTYRYHDQTRTIRMDKRPGDRLAIVDGEVVTSVASR